jgi:hypothetical protein
VFCRLYNIFPHYLIKAGFSKRKIIENKIKISPVGADLFFVDRRKDRLDEANSGFRNFAKAPQTV